MANPVLGKSLFSDCLFLSWDFAVWTVSMETVQSMYFCFGGKPGNSKFATKKKGKKVWILSFFTLKLPEEVKRIEIKDGWRKWTFLSASHRKYILLSETEYHIINNLLAKLAWAVLANIGPQYFTRSILSQPRTVVSQPGSVLSWPRANIPQYGPRALLVSG